MHSSLGWAEGITLYSISLTVIQPCTHLLTLICLAELVLNKNMFSFKGEVFSQMSGVAMDKKMGPSYACLFVGHFEQELLEHYSKPMPEIYKRYINLPLLAVFPS